MRWLVSCCKIRVALEKRRISIPQSKNMPMTVTAVKEIEIITLIPVLR